MSVAGVLSYTQDMMMLVLEQQWDVLLDMQLQQDEMLRSIFSGDAPVFTAKEQEGLFEVQRLNQQILVAAEAHKAEVAGKLREMHQGKSKAGAYQSL